MEEFIAFMKLREKIYKILSFGFYMEPDNEYISDLRSLATVFKSIADTDNNLDMAEGAEYIENYFKNGLTDEMVGELACVFARIFFVMNVQGGIKGISPCESVYLSPDKVVMGEERDEVMRAYAMQGIAKDKTLFREPEDHISAELYFMSQMSRKTYDIVESGNENETLFKLAVQLEFLKNHTMKWAGTLCNDIYNISDNNFYKGLAKMTVGFLNWDYDTLGLLMKAGKV